MRIFLAGIANKRSKDLADALGVRNFLLSYHALGAFKFYDDVISDPVKSMLIDSGAFSVWTKGAKIDIDEYARFAVELKDRSMCDINFVNLDVIPARFGTRPTIEQREEAAEKSFQNFLHIQKAHGLTTLNVFHQHENFEHLRRIDDHCDYYGVSPANDVSVKERDRWLDKVFTCLVSKHQVSALPRTHGFGITTTDLLKKYPFFSVDSTTWMNGAKFATYIAFVTEFQNLVQIQRGMIYPENAHQSDAAIHLARFDTDLSVKYEIGMRAFLGFEKFLTEVWKNRGVGWRRYGE